MEMMQAQQLLREWGMIIFWIVILVHVLLIGSYMLYWCWCVDQHQKIDKKYDPYK